MRAGAEIAPVIVTRIRRRPFFACCALMAGSLLLSGRSVLAQAIGTRQWQGANAITGQPEQIIATSNTEWRALWARVGSPAPDMFEPSRTNAVGIFLGNRLDEGYAVNVISISRRQDRLVVVFEERMPPEALMAQRGADAPRPDTIAPGTFGGRGDRPTSPWAIILINRADLPIAVEQRLFR